MSDTFWVALGSIGGTLGFAAVAWQAFLTRTSVKVSQLIAADSIRSRLDAQAPAVTVQLSPPPWEPLAWTNMGMPCNPWPAGHTWHFPAEQDGSNRIALQQVLVVENHSDRRVQLRFDGDLVLAVDSRPQAAGVLVLEPGEKSAEVYLQRDFTIKQLAENHAAREVGAELPHQVAGRVTVEDDRDNGNTDMWDLVLTGCPVEPVPDREGLWRVVGHHLTEGSGLRSLQYSLLPTRQRVHWVSRAKGVQLPAPGSAS